MIDLQIPNDFFSIGGPYSVLSGGFTVLSKDEKGFLIRLDRDFPDNIQTTKDKVIYASKPKDKKPLKAVRLASADDRQRFGRPGHMGRIVFHCCENPCKYLSIYDDGSGAFFDINVSLDDAITQKCGNLYYCFFCEVCGVMHTIDA